MRALVTGGTGFIGNRLVLHLARLGWEVVCLVRRPVVARRHGVITIQAPDFIPHSSEGIDCVFHLAAATSLRDFPNASASDFWAANAQPTVRVLELAETCNAKSFIHASTQLVIGKPRTCPYGIDHPCGPESPYALSKLAGELACEYFLRADRVPATSLRLTSVVGFGMREESVFPRFVKRALLSQDLEFHGTGARVQNFVHVDDVVRALVMAAEHPGRGVLNIGGTSSLSMKHLAELVLRSVQDSASRAVPSGAGDPQEGYRWIPDLEPARATLGYSPCVTMDSFVPGYASFLKNPAPIEQWWSEQ